MRLTYCFAICLMQIISYANGDEGNETMPVVRFTFKTNLAWAISMKDTKILHIKASVERSDDLLFNGEVCVTLNMTRFYNHDQIYKNFGCIDTVNGRFEFDFNMTEPAHVFEKYNNVDKRIRFEMMATDKDLNLTQKYVRYLNVYSNRYILNRCLGRNCTVYTPNVEQEIIYYITHVNGSDINDTKSIVELTYSDVYDINESQCEPTPAAKNPPLTFTGHMDDTGIVTFKVTLPELESYEGCRPYFLKKLKYLDEESIYTKVH